MSVPNMKEEFRLAFEKKFGDLSAHLGEDQPIETNREAVKLFKQGNAALWGLKYGLELGANIAKEQKEYESQAGSKAKGHLQSNHFGAADACDTVENDIRQLISGLGGEGK